MSEPNWLNPVEQRAWQGILVFLSRGQLQMERTLKEHDLIVVHFEILAALSDAPDNTLRLSDLANIANTSQSRLTNRLKTLTARGDISIAPDPEDGRAKRATLTDAGRRRMEDVAPAHVADVRRLVFDHLEEEETLVLSNAFAKIAGNLCDHAEFQCAQELPAST